MKKSVSGNVITFSFDGEAPVTFDVSAVTSPACIAYAPIHAYLAKIGDAAAIPREDKAGNIRTITEAMRREAVATMVEALMKPDATWNQRIATIERNPHYVKLAELRGWTYEEELVFQNEKMVAEMQELIDAGK